jgi:hypothetical protein
LRSLVRLDSLFRRSLNPLEGVLSVSEAQ